MKLQRNLWVVVGLCLALVTASSAQTPPVRYQPPVQQFGLAFCRAAPATTTTLPATEQVLATCTIPANTLNVDGQAVEFNFIVALAATANTKQIKVHMGGIGGTLVVDSGATTSSGGRLATQGPCFLHRQSASLASSNCSIVVAPAGTNQSATAFLQNEQAGISVDWTVSNDFVITATDGTAAGGSTLAVHVEALFL